MARTFALILLIMGLHGAAFAQPSGRSQPLVPTPEQAPIAMLVDVTSGQVLHQRDPDRRFVPASITKAMTAYVAFEKIEAGELDPAQIIPVPYAVSDEWRGKGSTMFLDGGDRIPLSLLLTGIMNVSANDASIVLAQHATGKVDDWLLEMNRAAQSLDMFNSRFGTPNGWPDEGKTFTTARDLVKLASALISQHPQKYAAYIGREGLRYKAYAQANRDPLVGRFEGADGIKTGYTNEAGFGYLGSAERDGRRLVMVLAGTQRARIRDQAARDYLEWGFSAFEQVTLFDAGHRIGSARVQGGEARQVDLKTETPVQINLLKNSQDQIEMTIEYAGPLRAPLDSDQRVAVLRIRAEGVEPAIVPLLTTQEVKVAGFWTRLFNGLIGWFA